MKEFYFHPTLNLTRAFILMSKSYAAVNMAYYAKIGTRPIWAME